MASIDTKKKELVGRYRNGGREWRPKGQPEEVKVHDFIDRELGKAIPYGVYDLTANTGWVSVGVDHDTAEFAVETVRRWWLQMGRQAYPSATRLLLLALWRRSATIARPRAGKDAVRTAPCGDCQQRLSPFYHHIHVPYL